MLMLYLSGVTYAPVYVWVLVLCIYVCAIYVRVNYGTTPEILLFVCWVNLYCFTFIEHNVASYASVCMCIYIYICVCVCVCVRARACAIRSKRLYYYNTECTFVCFFCFFDWLDGDEQTLYIVRAF